MHNNKCKRSFPKDYIEETRLIEDCYAKLQRRNDGRKYKHGLDNRYVVPYNLGLLKRYRAHINVEVCISIASVKYLYKYIYKGYDCADIEI